MNGVNSVTDSVSRLDISTPSNSNTNQSAAVDCKCGMPLCICEVPSNDDVAPVQASHTHFNHLQMHHTKNLNECWLCQF